jgi:acyl-CoA dehydrogenase
VTSVADPTKEFADAIADGAAAAVDAADEVDREARFPSEAFEVLRARRALSAYVPRRLGGAEMPFPAVARACFDLGRACAATGMVFAMHQIQVGALVRHADGSDALERYLEELTERQLLLASATSEVGVGGDLRRSIAAVERDGDSATLEKRAQTISYGATADGILVTARRDPEAEPGDQVLALVRREEFELEPAGTWDSLGMRGTCSPGFVLRARFAPENVLPTPFADIAPQTMVPFSHILWSQVWLGIATAAFERARSYVRELARARPDSSPAPTRLSELAALHQRMRNEVDSATTEYTSMLASDEAPDDLFTIGYATRINLLKINASQLAPEICTGALGLTGMAGYQNTTPFSVGRHIRDSLSAALMIANERIHATNAALLLVQRG